MNEKGDPVSSREVRWFFNEKISELENWFNSKDSFFQQQKERRDFYLDLFPVDNISYKLRDGKTEIKTKIEVLSTDFHLEKCSGIAEAWVKWSLQLKKDLTTPDQIYDSGVTSFIEVIKRRLLIKFEVHPDGEISKWPKEDFPTEGCQVELTMLHIKGKEWHTFAFEAFGTDRNINRNFNLVTKKILDQIPDIKLEKKDSFSYPVFLKPIRLKTNAQILVRGRKEKTNQHMTKHTQ